MQTRNIFDKIRARISLDVSTCYRTRSSGKVENFATDIWTDCTNRTAVYTSVLLVFRAKLCTNYKRRDEHLLRSCNVSSIRSIYRIRADSWLASLNTGPNPPACRNRRRLCKSVAVRSGCNWRLRTRLAPHCGWEQKGNEKWVNLLNF